MTDLRLRELELRWLQTNDVHDEVRYLRARLRERIPSSTTPVVGAWRSLLFLVSNGTAVEEALQLVAKPSGDEMFQSVASERGVGSPDVVEALAAGSSAPVARLVRWADRSGMFSECEAALIPLLEPRPDRVWTLCTFVELLKLRWDPWEAAEIVRMSLGEIDGVSEVLLADLDLLIHEGRELGSLEAINRASHLFPAPLPRLIPQAGSGMNWDDLEGLLEDLRCDRLQLPPIDALESAEALQRLFLLLGRVLDVVDGRSAAIQEVGPWVGADLKAWTEATHALIHEGEDIAHSAELRPDLFPPWIVRLMRIHPVVFPKVSLDIARRLARGDWASFLWP